MDINIKNNLTNDNSFFLVSFLLYPLDSKYKIIENITVKTIRIERNISKIKLIKSIHINNIHHNN